MDFNRSIKYWLPVVVWMVFIFSMSTGEFTAQNTSRFIEPIIRFLLPWASTLTIDVLHGVIRKCGHLTEYFILGLLLFRAFWGGSKEGRVTRWAALAVLVVVLYAASDEFHQWFVPGRTASPMDVGIDTVGGILAQGVTVFRAKRHSRGE